MGIFTKKRKDASPQISHQESSANSSSSSHEHQPATPEAYLYAPNSLSTGFKVISGRKRRDSNMSMFSAKTAAPGLESSGSNTGAFKVHQQSSTVNRSVDALPLAHSASPSLSSSTGPSSNRHRASPLARPPSPSARSVKSVRSFFKITTKPLKPTSNKPANAPTDNTTDAGDFNLRSFRPASSNQTLPSMPTPPQPRTSSHSLRPALDVLPTPRPAFAAQHTRSSSSNSLPPNATASSPSHRSQSPSQSSISVSQFNQAKAMRSGAASLKTSSSVSSFNQLLQNTTAANADDQSNRPLSPSPSAQKRSSLGPPLSRPSSRLDLPLPTPSRVAPSRPLPKRRSSAIEPGLEYYSEYFGSPSATPALETSGTKDALFGSATPADMPSDPSNRRLSASPMPDSAALPLQSTMPSRPQSMAEDDDEKPLRPPILPHSNNSNRRTLSGTSLMNAASEWGSSLVNYLTTPEEEAKQEAKARLERSKSKAVGRSAWGNDSESEDEQEQEEDTSDSDGGLQLNVKKPSAPATPARSHNERSPTASAWDSDEAVIRREEARKQALLAQTSDSPFIRSSFSPPTPISSPKSAATPLSDSSHSKPPPSALASSQAPRPHSTFFNQAHVAPPQLAPMQLDESNLEVLNETNKLNGSAVDDDDDEAPLASIAARSSHHRAQSDLCKPSGSRMSFMSTRTGSPGTYGGQASSPLPLNHPRPSSTIDLKQPGLSPGQMRGKPSLSALIDGKSPLI